MSARNWPSFRVPRQVASGSSTWMRLIPVSTNRIRSSGRRRRYPVTGTWTQPPLLTPGTSSLRSQRQVPSGRASISSGIVVPSSTGGQRPGRGRAGAQLAGRDVDGQDAVARQLGPAGGVADDPGGEDDHPVGFGPVGEGEVARLGQPGGQVVGGPDGDRAGLPLLVVLAH